MSFVFVKQKKYKIISSPREKFKTTRKRSEEKKSGNNSISARQWKTKCLSDVRQSIDEERDKRSRLALRKPIHRHGVVTDEWTRSTGHGANKVTEVDYFRSLSIMHKHKAYKC